MSSSVGPCLEHPELTGTPCARCGTFRCGACLETGLCPSCRGNAGARPPQSEDAVGFGRRAGGRILDMVAGQAAGLAGGVAAGIVLAVLELTGVTQGGWADRLDHGFGFNFLSGAVASLLGMALATAICGASPGKAMLGLRVVRTDGERPGVVAGLIRELAYFVDSLFFGLIAKGQMDGSALQQRLGDQWAGTVVVHARTLPSGISGSTARLLFGLAVGLFVQALVLAVFFVVAAL